MKSQIFHELNPRAVLGVAAHPDDLDFGAAGTLTKFADLGARVYYHVLTGGGKGSKDRDMTCDRLQKVRRKEQQQAAEVVGAEHVFFDDYTDGELTNSLDVRRSIVKVIRKVMPDVVVTTDPSLLYMSSQGMINHPDHRAAGQATLDAVYPFARDHMSFPELEKGYEPHEVATMLLINPENHNYGVDITSELDTKFNAIKAHTSQVPRNFDPLQERLTRYAQEAGEPYGYGFAETFMRIDIDV